MIEYSETIFVDLKEAITAGPWTTAQKDAMRALVLSATGKEEATP